MLEAQIEIPDALASEGYKRAMAFKAATQIAGHYSRNVAVIWVVISIADALAGASHLIGYHLLILVATMVVATVMRYQKWSEEVAAMKGWSFHAKLDDDGVMTTSPSPDVSHSVSWSSYKNYVEYDTYLQIEHDDGNFSFLPKTPELFDMIEFTKAKIPPK